ncbi:MAG: amidohydrolase family protein [Acidobacteria bacterium]|nr:amidohydrolase family protein [Acidobacteriota bacterium]
MTRAATLPTSSAHPPFTGYGAILRLSEGPDILDIPDAAMTALVGGMATPSTGGSRAAQWGLLREELRAAQRQLSGTLHASAADLGDAAFSSINLSALAPVLQKKIPLAITAYRESDIRQAVSLADDFHMRLILIGAEEAWRAAGLLAAHHVPVILNPYADDPATFDQIGARLDNPAILDRAGVTISFLAPSIHVNHNAGITIREGAGIAVANGLPWPRALRALTLNAAETWGITNHYGALEPGKDADLVIWNGDPLEPMNAPIMVFVRGKQVSLRTRQTQLEKRYAPAEQKTP